MALKKDERCIAICPLWSLMFRVLLGAVLVGTGFTKLFSQSEIYLLNLSLLRLPEWFFFIHGVFEVSVGLLTLLGNVWAKLIYVISVFAYVGILVSSSAHGISHCGCAGAFEVSPETMLCFDVFLIVGLFCLILDDGVRLRLVGSVVLGGIAIGMSLWATHQSELKKLGYSALRLGAINAGDPVFLNTDKWIGRPFPLEDYLECKVNVFDGEIALVLVRENCDACKRYLRDKKYPNRRVVLIWLNGEPKIGQFENVSHCKVKEGFEFLVSTPTEILVSDGVVRECFSNE